MGFEEEAFGFFEKPNAERGKSRMLGRMMARSGKPHPDDALAAHRMEDDGFIIPTISASSMPESQAGPIAASMMRIHAGVVAVNAMRGAMQGHNIPVRYKKRFDTR